MVQRRFAEIRVSLVALLLLAFGPQAPAARSALLIDARGRELAATPPIAETLALPSARAVDQATAARRDGPPIHPIVLDVAVAAALRRLPCFASPCPPRARSNPVRQTRPAAADPPPR